MTSAEIDTYRSKHGNEANDPLWEIALQLAKKNEREERGDRESTNRMLRKVGLEEIETGVAERFPRDTIVLAIQRAFPFVNHDGYRGGRQWWGVWYGPGPAARSFSSKEAAEKHLADNPPMEPPPARQNFTIPPGFTPVQHEALKRELPVRAKKELPKKSVRPRKRSGFRY